MLAYNDTPPRSPLMNRIHELRAGRCLCAHVVHACMRRSFQRWHVYRRTTHKQRTYAKPAKHPATSVSTCMCAHTCERTLHAHSSEKKKKSHRNVPGSALCFALSASPARMFVNINYFSKYSPTLVFRRDRSQIRGLQVCCVLCVSSRCCWKASTAFK